MVSLSLYIHHLASSTTLMIDFYCFLLWPFVESYWLAAVSLFSLVPPNSSSSSSLAVTQSAEATKTEIHLSGKTWEGFSGIKRGEGALGAKSSQDDRARAEVEEGKVMWVDERAFMDQVLTLGKTLYYEGKMDIPATHPILLMEEG